MIHPRLTLTVWLLVLYGITPHLHAAQAAPPPPQDQLHMNLTIHGRPEHPIVYLCKADIEQAKRNRERYPWARKAATDLLKRADAWADKSDADLIGLIPAEHACFAYGFAGCPICGGTLKSWWGAGGVASLSDPGHIRCVNGHRLPDHDHPDSGTGWTDKDGKKFYFVGTYNSFVIDTLTSAMTDLVNAYALSGEQKYAHKAAVILDHLARIYPSCTEGSWDYPSNPPRGRFNRPWYQVARALVLYVNDYDILMMGDELDQPSSVPGLTRRQNIEQNLLLNGAAFCHEISVKEPALHNGMADYMRGQLAVGAAMGIPQYIKWGCDGPYGLRAMIANNVDRDGQYYETSAGYSDHARGLYMDMAEILQRYRDADHPNGINFCSDPAFVALNLLPRTRLSVAGLEPNLGDDAPKPNHMTTPQGLDVYDFRQLEHLRALNHDNAMEIELDSTLVQAVGKDLEQARSAHGPGDWLLFHAKDVASDVRSTGGAPRAPGDSLVHPLTNSPLDQSDLLSQRGLAILRNGDDGENAIAATVRGGPTLNHGHFDELGLHVYARGNELTYDIGYILGSTHTQVGWAQTTASHNTVLVDEARQLQAGLSGGSIKQFLRSPGVSLVTINDPACYAAQKVKRYARTVAMVKVAPGQAYLLDVFRVEGGHQHDYIFHARGTDVSFDGITMGPEQPGSLAGKNIDWASKLGSDGDVKGKPNKPYWNPPPGNGLGFLPHPRSATAPRNPWSITWNVDPNTPSRLKLTMLPIDGEIITSAAPGNYPRLPKAQYILARRSGKNLKSTFTSIVEPFAQTPVVRHVVRLKSSDDAVAVRVDLTDGQTDYLIYREPQSQTRSWSDQDRSIEFDGTFALIRCQGGKALQATAVGGRLLRSGDLTLQIEPEILTPIERIDYDKNILYAKADLPAGGALAGQFLYVSNPGYAQSSAYRIASVSRDGDLTAIHLAPTRLILGRGHMDTDPPGPHALPNVTPLEYGHSLVRVWSGFFRGKFISTPDGRASTWIQKLDQQAMGITVKQSSGFKAGNDLVIYDIRPGDQIRLPRFAQMSRDNSGAWPDHQ
jgi:hypothetical protein